MDRLIFVFVMAPVLLAAYLFIACLMFACAALTWELIATWSAKQSKERLRDIAAIASLAVFGGSLVLIGFDLHLAYILGGDTCSGKVVGDKFYVGRGGSYTEVSEGYWALKRRTETLAR